MSRAATKRLARFAYLSVLLLCLGSPATLLAQPEEETTVSAPPPVPAANPLKTQDELQAAYQKEYAFLEAQLRDLQGRLSTFNSESQQAERDREARIDRVEGEYIDLQSRAERVTGLLTEAERQISAVEDSRDTLEATFLQAGSTLAPYGLQALTTEAYLSAGVTEKIHALFASTLELLGSIGKVRSAYRADQSAGRLRRRIRRSPAG